MIDQLAAELRADRAAWAMGDAALAWDHLHPAGAALLAEHADHDLRVDEDTDEEGDLP